MSAVHFPKVDDLSSVTAFRCKAPQSLLPGSQSHALHLANPS